MILNQKEMNVPSELVVNMDETGLNTMSFSKTTLAPKGSKQVPGLTKGATSSVTKVTCMTANGILLPYMIIFEGKTGTVLPDDVEPAKGSLYTCTATHFANWDTTLIYIRKVIVPYVQKVRGERSGAVEATGNPQWAILIWDNFSAHHNDLVSAELEKFHIKSFFLPPNCTSVGQPLDVNFNGPEKMSLKQHFTRWYSKEHARRKVAGSCTKTILPTSMIRKRRLIAIMVRRVHELMENMTSMMIKAWKKAGLDVVGTMDLDDTDEVDRVPIDDILVEEMLELTMNEVGMEVDPVDAAEDHIFEDLTLTAPDSAEHMNAYDLYDSLYDVENENLDMRDEYEEESMHDGDESYFEHCVVPRADETVSCASNGNISVESCQKVELTKVQADAGWMRVKYETSQKITPEELVSILKRSRKGCKSIVLTSTRNRTKEGFEMCITGADRSTILDGGKFFTFGVSQ
jgi:hypothetical protein